MQRKHGSWVTAADCSYFFWEKVSVRAVIRAEKDCEDQNVRQAEGVHPAGSRVSHRCGGAGGGGEGVRTHQNEF